MTSAKNPDHGGAERRARDACERFLDTAQRLVQSDDPEEQARLKDELARLTVGA
jgi:hypothetical protein